jgi:hypothetical protein
MSFKEWSGRRRLWHSGKENDENKNRFLCYLTTSLQLQKLYQMWENCDSGAAYGCSVPVVLLRESEKKFNPVFYERIKYKNLLRWNNSPKHLWCWVHACWWHWCSVSLSTPFAHAASIEMWSVDRVIFGILKDRLHIPTFILGDGREAHINRDSSAVGIATVTAWTPEGSEFDSR